MTGVVPKKYLLDGKDLDTEIRQCVAKKLSLAPHAMPPFTAPSGYRLLHKPPPVRASEPNLAALHDKLPPVHVVKSTLTGDALLAYVQKNFPPPPESEEI